MKSAFVTGGGGYVGRLLCEELARQGYLVTAFDLSFQETENELDGITRVSVSRGEQFLRVLAKLVSQGDVTDGPALEEAVRQSGACVLFHLASYGMSGREQVSPVSTAAH